MSITAEKIALDAAKLPKRVTDDDAHAIISGPEKWSFIKGYAYALLQQGEPEGALRKAYNKIEQHMLDYTHETHSYDASTNAWECSNGEVVAYVEGLDKALEIIKPLLSASPLPPAPGAETGAEHNTNVLVAQGSRAQAGAPVSEVTGSIPVEDATSSRQAALEEGMNEAARIVDLHAAEAENLNLTLLPSGLRAIAKAIRGAAIRSRALATTPPAEGETK